MKYVLALSLLIQVSACGKNTSPISGTAVISSACAVTSDSGGIVGSAVLGGDNYCDLQMNMEASTCTFTPAGADSIVLLRVPNVNEADFAVETVSSGQVADQVTIECN